MKTVNEIENQFLDDIRLFTLSPSKTKKTILQIISEYNLSFQDNKINYQRKFNAVIFSHLFTKLRTIGFSIQLIKNPDFIVCRKLLIEEINYKSMSVAKSFTIIFCDSNILSLNKDIYSLIYIAFSHYVEIFNNLHQYKQITIEKNIGIAKTYITDLKKYKINDTFLDAINHAVDFLSKVIENEKTYLTTAST